MNLSRLSRIKILISDFLIFNLQLKQQNRCNEHFNKEEVNVTHKFCIHGIFYCRIALTIPPARDGDEASSLGYSKCFMYSVNFTELIENGTVLGDPSWPTQRCQHGWEYNFTDIPYETVASQVLR